MTWLTWPGRLLVFALWFAKEVIVCNLTVLRDNVTPGQNSTPGIVRLPTRCRTDGEVTLLGALITLTPGTLTLGTNVVGSGTRVLFVHGMYNSGAEDLRSDLEEMESRMLHAVRRRGDGR
ncbi:Na+/H+ antiporter subunit E [Ruania suaedae]|uniref:Na+/H+ antiporter subunit E n=1 Tax=Ruania suaedae TaxID=2897774 RepID=UPI001E33B210|nr:Na+/H+ antiporter subunit E [Ruania suaedae]UFU02952.1 Na+/H+ antiporter subunit E [Ruania suaedae]